LRLGDINQSYYFPPVDAGPAAVVLTMPGRWVIGSLARQLWSFAGDGDRQDVSQTLIQPFVNYNLPGGWYAVSSPIVTANWEVDNDETSTVPVGGGIGRIFHVGGQAMNAQLQTFYNLESPQYGPDWSIRFQLRFLFTK